MAESFVRPERPPERVLQFSVTQLFDAVTEYACGHRLLPPGPARCLLTVNRETGAATLEYWEMPAAPPEVANGL